MRGRVPGVPYVRRGPGTRAGRLAAAALAAWLAAGCGGEGAPGPVAGPYPGREPPRTVEEGEVPFLEFATPRESLYVRERPAGGELHLLFYRGQGAARDARGRAYVPDPDGSRILAVGPGPEVVGTVGGPSEESGALGLPLSVAATREGGAFVVDVEHPKGLLYFDPSGRFVGASAPPVLNPNLAAGPSGALWAARSPYILGFDPAEPGDPLLYRFDPLAGEGVGIAEVEPTDVPAWSRLANAGAVAAGEDGTGYFAFLLRNELRAYAPDGELLWRTRRLVGFPTPPPSVEVAGEEVRFRFRPVTQALTLGPDGLLYALVASDEAPGGGGRGAAVGEGRAAEGPVEGTPPGAAGHRRVEVYDPRSGELLRASAVPASWTTLAADAEGRVYRVDPERILRSAPPPERRSLPPVALVGFHGDTTTFEDYRGKALLINFWASWCEPCKKELPELKEYYGTLDRDRVEFLAISEDTNERAARRFAASFDLPFPLFLGRGRMREHFRYIGLPYTVVADYRGRIVAEFLGFGSERTWRRLTEALEGEMERAAPATPDAGEGADGGEGEGGHQHHGAAEENGGRHPGHGG